MKHESRRHELAPVQVLAPVAAPMPSYSYTPPPAEESPGLLSFVDHLLQHAKLFAFVWVGVLIAGIGYVLLVPPLWQADALVQIDSRGPRPLATTMQQSQLGGNDPPLLGFVQGELEILRSRDIVSKAIAQTNADLDVSVDNRLPLIGGWYARTFGRGDNGPQAPPLDVPGLDTWSWGGETLRVASLKVPPSRFGQPLWLQTAASGGWSLFDENDRVLARGAGTERVDFQLDGKAAELQVAKLVANPGTRFRVVPNDPAAVYDGVLLNLRAEEAGRQSGVIRVSYTNNDPKLAVAFLDAITAGYLDHHLKVRTSEASRALAFLDDQLPVIKRQLDRSEESLNEYRTGINSINVGQDNENSLRRIADLERERVGIELRRQQVSERFTSQHPEVQALTRQIATVSGELTRLRGQMRQAPRQEKDVVRLQRDVAVNTQLYTALLNNAQELRLAQAGMTGNARLVDAAGVQSKPVKPRPATVLSIAAVLGLIAAFGGVLLARLLRPTLRTAEELERTGERVALASIPESPRQRMLMRTPRLWRSRLQQRLLAVHAPMEPAVEGLRGLRNSIALRENDGEGQTVLITAPTTEAGKSFVAANLAVLMAAADRRVLLVDMDLRAPRLHAYFGVSRARLGLSDVLAGRCSLADAVVLDVLPGLDLLLTGHLIHNPGELLLQPRFEALLNELRHSYAQVVIDSAPVLPISDTLAIGRLADLTYLVVRSEANTEREVRDAVRRLEAVGAEVDGLVLNGVKRGRLASVPYRGYFPREHELRGAH